MYAENLFVGIVFPLCLALFLVKGNARRFCAFLVAGMGICLLTSYINSFLIAVAGFTLDDAAVFITPISEECMKLLPILFYFLIYSPEEDNLLMAAIAVSVGFATFENCCYLLTAGELGFQYAMIRGLSVGVLHVGCGLTMAFGFILLNRLGYLKGIGAIGIFALTVTCHAIYNLLVSRPGITRWIGYALPLSTLVMLYIWWKRGKKI